MSKQGQRTLDIYTNHRVICLVVIGSSFDSEQVFQVSNGYRRSDDNSSTFFIRKVELMILVTVSLTHSIYNCVIMLYKT